MSSSPEMFNSGDMPSPESPLVSVILPCYNAERFVGQALGSVAKQSYLNWEVIVVEDASADGTEKIVEQFGRQHPAQRVEYYRNRTNQGVSATRNFAIQHAGGRYIAFLDPDDLWPSEYITQHITAFRTVAANADVTYTSHRYIDEGNRELGIEYGPGWWELQNFPASVMGCNFINTSCAVVKRSTLDAVGYFDTNPELQHVEDWDLWIRLALEGYRFHYLESTFAFYRRHPAAASDDEAKMDARTAALRRKHVSSPAFTRGLVLYLAHLENDYRSLQRELGAIPIRRLKRWFHRRLPWLFSSH